MCVCVRVCVSPCLDGFHANHTASIQNAMFQIPASFLCLASWLNELKAVINALHSWINLSPSRCPAGPLYSRSPACIVTVQFWASCIRCPGDIATPEGSIINYQVHSRFQMQKHKQLQRLVSSVWCTGTDLTFYIQYAVCSLNHTTVAFLIMITDEELQQWVYFCI